MNQTTRMKPSEQKQWLKYYSQEALNEETPKCSVYQYLKQTNKNRLNQLALNYYGKKINFSELFERIDECANAFSAIGVKEGDIVSLLSVSVPETVFAIYALNKIGATVNTIDPRMDVNSIKRMVEESGSSVLVVLDLAYAKVRQIRGEIDQKHIIVQPDFRSLPYLKKTIKNITTKIPVSYNDVVIDWDTFIKGGKNVVAAEAPYKGDATVAITYTGGTTGFPKGVMITNDGMNSVSFNFKHSSICAKPGEKFLGIIPVFSSYGLVCGLHMPLTLGLTMVLVPNFQPHRMGKLVKSFRPQHMISVPAFYEILMESKEVKNLDLSFLITLGSGGDTMNEGLESKLYSFMKEHNVNRNLAQGYGMSEVSAAASFCAEKVYKKGSVGIPSITTTIGIFKPDTFEELDVMEEGEICITGPSMMKGYYNKPEETDYVMRKHPDGRYWIHSGDIGYLDEDGFLFVNGRIKRMITRFDGHKIFPVNIESLVSEHPEVRNCCAVGITDRVHGQGQVPLVVAELSDCDKDAICKEIFKLCDSQLEERGKPVGVVSVDSIPLTGMGKNDYRTLEKTYANFDYTLI
ncbi:MAG: acyl--CoA ligase [Clostridia bacterium]|nr:acyl--CoA ligase [Clostridia bacterium]